MPRVYDQYSIYALIHQSGMAGLQPTPDEGLIRYLRRMAASRRRVAVKRLDAAARYLDPARSAVSTRWSEISETELTRVLERLSVEQPLTKSNAVRRTIQAVFDHAQLAGALTPARHSMLRAVLRLERERGRTAGMAPFADIGPLLETCARDEGPRGARDGALIALIWQGRLSGPEAAALAAADARKAGDNADPATQRALERWSKARGDREDPFLLTVSGSGTIVDRGMTRSAVTRAVVRRSESAGLVPMTPETLRLASLRRGW